MDGKGQRRSGPACQPSLWITDLPRDEKPRLLIVIPFKDQVETTIQCLESIERQEHQLDVRVALVNNRSIEPETLPRLNEWISQPRTTSHLIVDDDGAFNFARLNNTAIRQFGEDRELILFLNNDVVLTTPQCLQVMSMTLLSHPWAGMVGIKLYYGDECESSMGAFASPKDIRGPGYDLISPRPFCLGIRRCRADQPGRDVRLRHDPCANIRATRGSGGGACSQQLWRPGYLPTSDSKRVSATITWAV